MRTAVRTLAALFGLVLAACSSGSVTITRPVPRPAPVVYVDPLEIDIARPHNGRLFVQTNRAAYAAIFEIVPGRGVEMVYPARQRGFVVAGLRDVPAWWEGSRVTYHAGWSTSREYPGRYIYALASDEPLRIPDAAYRTGNLRDVLGARVYYSANPYATMRALARELVPAVRDEEWAEDMYVLSPSYATEHYRVTRVYCPGGPMYEVPVELADRVWCPTYVRGRSSERDRVSEVELPGYRRPLTRPDSVVGDNGRRVAVRAGGANGRGPIQRVQEPAGPDNGRRVVPNEPAGDPVPRGRGREVLADRGGARPDPNGAAKPDANVGSKPDANTASKPDRSNESKRDAGTEAKPASVDGAKPQASGERRAESRKGRGRAEGKDGKAKDGNPADGKSTDGKAVDGKPKEPREPKPLG